MVKFGSKIVKHPGWIVFGLALVVRFAALALHRSALTEPLIKDAKLYELLARAVVSGQGLFHAGQSSALVPPLYPLFLAGIYELFSPDRMAILIFQAFLGGLLVLILYCLTVQVFSARTGWIAALAAVFYWPFISLGLQYRSEALFLPLLAAGIYYTVIVFREKKPGQAGLAGLFLGLAALTRSAAFYLPFLIAAGLGLDFIKQRLAGSLAAAAVLIVAFSLVYAPWIVRNYLVMGKPLVTTSNTGQVLYSGIFPYKNKIYGRNLRLSDLPLEKRFVMELPEVQRDSALKEMALAEIKRSPLRTFNLLPLKTAYFWSPFDWEVLGDSGGTFNPWFVWACLFAAAWLALGTRPPASFIPAGVILYTFALCLVTYGSPRLRLPAEPFIIVLAAQGWAGLETRLSRKEKTFLILVVIATVILGWIYGGEIKKFCSLILTSSGVW